MSKPKYTLDYVKKNLADVHIDHYRVNRNSGSIWPVSYFYENWRSLKYAATKGGKTVLEFKFKNKLVEVVAEAICSPNDVFWKSIGVRICIMRALKEAGFAYKKNRTVYIANPAYNKRLAAKHKYLVYCYSAGGTEGPSISKYNSKWYPGRWIKVTL